MAITMFDCINFSHNLIHSVALNLFSYRCRKENEASRESIYISSKTRKKEEEETLYANFFARTRSTVAKSLLS